MDNISLCFCGKQARYTSTFPDGAVKHFCCDLHGLEYFRAQFAGRSPVATDPKDVKYNHRAACRHVSNAPGIYCITNEVTGEQYVGQAINMNARCRHHRSKLLWGGHPNDRLAEAARAYDIDVFRFDVLECVANQQLLLDRESYYIDKLRAAYNLGPPATSWMIPLAISLPRDMVESIEHLGVSPADFIREAVEFRLATIDSAKE